MADEPQVPEAHAHLMQMLEAGHSVHKVLIDRMENTEHGAQLKEDAEFLITMVQFAAAAHHSRNFLAEYVRTEHGIDPDNDEQVDEYLRRAAR